MSKNNISNGNFENRINTELFNETEVIKLLKSKQADSDSETLLNEVTAPQKSTRGRKRKYQSDEERILARRAQQKAYRERKKQELLELRALKAQLESKNKSNE